MPINWPDRYAPDRVAVRVHNEIEIAAPPVRVWAWLVRAAAWPTWYPNSSDVRIEDGAPQLTEGVRFTWRTFGVTVRSMVREYEPGARIAWDGTGLLMDIYHAWVIEPRAGGSWVVTEEHQNGLAPRLQSIFMPRRMYNGHQVWLQRLKAQAEAGPPN